MSLNTPVSAILEDAVKSVPGWTPVDQMLALYTLALSVADLPGDLLEVGSWCGRSAVALGLAARCIGHGALHCVDLFPQKEDWYRNRDGTYSFNVNIDGISYGAYTEQTVWEEPFLRDILPVYERCVGTLDFFRMTMGAHQLNDHVIGQRMDLKRFATTVPSDFKLRLAFIDGDHSYRSVCSDIDTIEPWLLPGAWLCFDDAFTSYDGINEAILEKVVHSGKYHLCQRMTRKLFVAQRVG